MKNAHLTILENEGNRKTTHVKDQDIERGGYLNAGACYYSLLGDYPRRNLR